MFKLPNRITATAYRGVTLIELCIAMMVMSILSIGVASIIRGGVESQMNDRMQSTFHVVSNTLMSDLRFDLARASSVAVVDAGMGLDIRDENNQLIEYQVYADNSNGVTGNSIRRIDPAGGVPRVYNKIGTSEYRPALRVTCGATLPPTNTACFSGTRIVPAVNGVGTVQNDPNTPTRVEIASVMVYPPEYVTGTDYLSASNFGPPRFRMENTSFDILSNIEFR